MDHRRGVVIDAMQADPERHRDCVNICRAGASGADRTPARPPWAAGAGSGSGSGTSSPAIKRPSGVNSLKGKRGHTEGRKQR